MKNSLLKYTSLTAITWACLSTPALANTNICNVDTPMIYDEPELKYNVYRKNRKIGKHSIQFEKDDNILTVKSETELKVKLLFITLFRYEYTSEEKWCGNQLLSIKTKVNDNGKKQEMSGLAQDGLLVIEGDESREYPLENLYTTNHWNASVTQTSQILNTITGNINQIEVTELGNEIIPGKTGKEATRYAYRGQLNIDSFYDAQGRWNGMAFEHEDGSPIEFRCVECGADDKLAENQS